MAHSDRSTESHPNLTEARLPGLRRAAAHSSINQALRDTGSLDSTPAWCVGSGHTHKQLYPTRPRCAFW